MALLVGAPVALTLGYLYYRQTSSVDEKSGGDDKKKKSLDSKAVSIDESGEGSTGSKCNGDAKKPLTPLGQAIEFKNQGNERFRSGKYNEAIELYDKAIQSCPNTDITELSTFYQNRAAAYENLQNWVAVRHPLSMHTFRSNQ